MFDNVVKEKILTYQESLAFKLGDKEMSPRDIKYSYIFEHEHH